MYKLIVINIVMICAFYNFWEVILMKSPMHFVWQTTTKNVWTEAQIINAEKNVVFEYNR